MSSDHHTQRGRILRLLLEARGDWVPLPAIVALAAQYSARIFELRRRGFRIENRTQKVGDSRHSWFRLELGPKPGLGVSDRPVESRPRDTGDVKAAAGKKVQSAPMAERLFPEPDDELGALGL